MRRDRDGLSDLDVYRYPVVAQHHYLDRGRGHQSVVVTVPHDSSPRFDIVLNVAYTHPSWRIWPGRADIETVYVCRAHVLVRVSKASPRDGIRTVNVAAYLSVHAVLGSPTFDWLRQLMIRKMLRTKDTLSVGSSRCGLYMRSLDGGWGYIHSW